MRSELMLLAATPLNRLIPAERRTVRNLASSLCVAMGILHEERNLVAILGLGGERSNQEAMESWVYCELVKENLDAGRDSLPTLINRLQDLEHEWRTY
ncbi:hypothetical protein [Marinobacter mobilis]|uniref:hypothetical protein n=1 Tax=Marinobacter mobilis TaxID=488533 RepID=UPI0035C6DF4F